MRLWMIFLLASAGAAPTVAHDLWIQPASFVMSKPASVPVTILVGHGASRQRWGAKPSRVVRFAEITASGAIDHRPALHLDSGSEDATLPLATAGTHLLVLETNHATSTLPATKFNDFLKDEGLTPALQDRSRRNTGNRAGREIYSRRAKALVQVGAATDDQHHVTRPVGLTLEIVPQRNPHALKPGEKLPVQVFFDGQPLAGATVKLNNLDFDVKPLAVQLTDATGSTSFEVPQRGKWQLNVIWTRPLADNPAADYDTTFSSLSFGFATAAAPKR